jgi:hypothetical protein
MNSRESQFVAGWASSVLLILLVVPTMYLLGCSAKTESRATGQIRLEYLKASKSTVSLRLTNATDRPIAVRGSWTISFAIRVSQADSQVECESSPTGKSEVELPGFSHGKSRSFDILQGEAVTLVVSTELPSRYEGGVCKLSLILQDGTSVGPIQFSP